ncbi:Methionyl-tRNA formyltransferase [Podospora australis]|uniref:methionyl-tRNA formyltransferase n=1 Tax=Podospora australis TaxID=1536484 RepID=A0AAN6X0P8_9PEZI|nr:Methionyl-tRNA formyltransferase [Podospora australis]
MLLLAATRRSLPLFQRSIKRPSSLVHRAFYRPGDKPLKSDPLRILFCGSDDFSCHSLKALHEEHKTNPSLIESLEVLIPTPKPTGRGLKKLNKAPISTLAEELKLPIHMTDKQGFKTWEMPAHINLIIAVSFGLFIPPRLLSQAKYGGLNVHPSILPRLHGPAPIQHAILTGYEETGVTIQTLSPIAFDEGQILKQSARISIREKCTFQELHDALAPMGASLLVSVLRENLHIDEFLKNHSTANAWEDGVNPADYHAPKIKVKDREVFSDKIFEEIFQKPEIGDKIETKFRALGPLWAEITLPDSGKGSKKVRLILDDIFSFVLKSVPHSVSTRPPGEVEDKKVLTKDGFSQMPTEWWKEVDPNEYWKSYDQCINFMCNPDFDNREVYYVSEDDLVAYKTKKFRGGILFRFKRDGNRRACSEDDLILRIGKIKEPGKDFKPAASVAQRLGIWRREAPEK